MPSQPACISTNDALVAADLFGIAHRFDVKRSKSAYWGCTHFSYRPRAAVRHAMRLTLLTIAAAALFVAVSGSALPAVVASHFDVAGIANGYMPRGSYIAVMLGVTVLVPLGAIFAGNRIASLPNELINLPNKGYWLAPERRTASMAWLISWLHWLSRGLALFLCFVHWLLLRGNAADPPHLEQSLFWAALIGVLTALGLGIIALHRRFSRTTVP
jgi:hypothetical protein